MFANTIYISQHNLQLESIMKVQSVNSAMFLYLAITDMCYSNYFQLVGCGKARFVSHWQSSKEHPSVKLIASQSS